MPGVGHYDLTEYKSINMSATKTSWTAGSEVSPGIGSRGVDSNFGLPHNRKHYVSDIGEKDFMNREGPGVAIYSFEKWRDDHSPKKEYSFPKVRAMPCEPVGRAQNGAHTKGNKAWPWRLFP